MLQKKGFVLGSLFIALLAVGCGGNFQSPGSNSATSASANSSSSVSALTVEISKTSETVSAGTDVLVVATIVGDDSEVISYSWQKQNTNGTWDDIGVQSLSLRFTNVSENASGIYQLLVVYQTATGPTKSIESPRFELIVQSPAQNPNPTPAPSSCGALAHGASQNRLMYQAASVVAPAVCQQETQTRTCNNGTLSSWSPMNYFNASCMVNNQAPIISALYVSPSGSDTNSGGSSSPFRTFARAYNSATAGTTIYLRGGVYTLTTQFLLNRSGASGNPIRVFNYPGEVPVIDGINMSTSGWTEGAALRITGNWNHVKGLEVRNGPEFGAVMEAAASNNTFEQLNVHHSGRLSNWEGKGIVIFGSGSNNRILNCDSHHNRDLRDDNADGFMVSTTGSGTVLQGNRAWRNSDDGYDLFNVADNTVGGVYTLEDNWAFENGYDDNMNVLGDGNGFKLGGRRVGTTTVNGGHLVRNCVAWRNHMNGFDDNGWHGGTRNFTLYNNTSFENGYSDYAFTNTQSLFRNNISVGSPRGAETRAGSNITQNSWTLPVTANPADFASTNSSIAVGPRNADGSLPTSNFLRLAPGSDLINRGVDVGLPYSGSAPDLGAYEF